MLFMSYTVCTRLISKTNCSVETLYASLTSREAEINWKPQCFTAWGNASISKEQKGTQGPRSHRLEHEKPLIHVCQGI